MKMAPYHYKECGLDNVFIHNMKTVKDDNDQETIYIPKINKLHKAISLSIVSKNGLLNNKEIRFLRTQLGMRQAEFSKMLGMEEQAVGRWERGDNPHTQTVDILIRTMVISLMGFDIPIQKVSEKSAGNVSVKDKINIDASNDQYSPMGIAA